MKRVILLIAALALAAALGVAPYGLGLQAEKTYRKILERPRGPGEPALAARSYARGWFSSRAETEIRADAALLQTYRPYVEGLGLTLPEALTFTADEVISHGPWPLAGLGSGVSLLPVQAVIRSTITPDSATRELLAHFTGSVEPLRVTRTVYLGGSQRLRFRSGEGRIELPRPPSRDGAAPGSISLLWEDLQLSGTFSPRFEESGIAASALTLRLLPPPGELSLQGVELKTESAPGPHGLRLGGTSVRLGALRFTLVAKDSPGFSADGVKITTSISPSGDTLTLGLSLEVEDVGIAGKHYGPGVWEQEVRHLDPAALAKLKQDWQRAPRRAETDPAEARALLDRMVGALLEVARHSPELEITRLTLKTDEGEIRGKARAGVNDARLAPAAQGPGALLDALDAQAEIVVPAGVLEALVQAQVRRGLAAAAAAGGAPGTSEEQVRSLAESVGRQQIQALVALNYLVEEGKTFRIDLSYKDGRLLVNGQPLPRTRRGA